MGRGSSKAGGGGGGVQVQVSGNQSDGNIVRNPELDKLVSDIQKKKTQVGHYTQNQSLKDGDKLDSYTQKGDTLRFTSEYGDTRRYRKEGFDSWRTVNADGSLGTTWESSRITQLMYNFATINGTWNLYRK